MQHYTIGILEVAMSYEGGGESLNWYYPAYLRGVAYLEAWQGQRAAAEFRKMLDHPGVVGNFVTGARAHLQLVRAEAMSGNREAARRDYREFLASWKDANPDLPVLKQAKAEYARLS
jgi:hypothetical protein